MAVSGQNKNRGLKGSYPGKIVNKSARRGKIKMLNEMLSISGDESLRGMMQELAGFIIGDLNEVQKSGELAALLQDADPEIREAAVQVFTELGQLIVHLGEV